MATRYHLTPYSAELAGLAACAELLTVNGIPALAFDASVNESAVWSFRLPTGWTGTVNMQAQCIMASAVSGTVDLTCAVMAVRPGDALDLDSASSYDSDNATNGTTVPATAGYLFAVLFVLTNFDGGVGGSWVRLKLTRGAVGDSAAGDLYLLGLTIGDSA